jgi:virulence factor Mce-like protein
MTSFVDRPSTMRALGIGLLAVILGAIWLTWAFFNQTFKDYDDVTLTGVKSGLSLPDNADVKLRGMIVGEVRETKFENGHIKLTLGMYPDMIDKVPAGVNARIIPKTLFGEKYIDLVPPKEPVGGSLKAGDTITNAVVPVEFEKFFNDIYPLLTAVPPEKVGATLTAFADSLEGRGDELGETFILANNYLKKFNPESKQAVDDIVEFGKVSDTYASEMDDFGDLLKNSAEVSRTTVDIDDDLADFFDETTSLSQVLERLFKGIGKDWITSSHNSVKPLATLAEYSSMFPCLLRGVETLATKHVDSVFANGTLHVKMVMISPQPKEWGSGARGSQERPLIPTEDAIEAEALVQPDNRSFVGGVPALGKVCDQLNEYHAGTGPHNGGPYDHEHPFPPIPARFWKLLGVQNSHNGKLGKEVDYGRVAAASSNLPGVDTPAQRDLLNRMTAGLTGVKTADVPDVASLLISPVVRGAEVTIQ